MNSVIIYNTAKRYDLRYCTTSKQLRNDFESCVSVNQSDVIEGNLTSPADPYTMESITLRLPAAQISITFYFGIKSVDAIGQWSELSNVLSAGVYRVGPEDEPPAYFWILLCFSVVGLIVMIIVMLAVLLRTDGRNKGSGTSV